MTMFAKMTSFVNFTPILGGAKTEDSLCSYLLEIDDARLLLDCGWDLKDPEKLASVAGTKVDAVLLSHADLDHIGGYAYAVAKLGLDCPCYATTPVHDMGLQLMQDALTSKLNQSEFLDLTQEQVNKAFSKITLLRYSQPYSLSGKSTGIVITAFGAGHTVGTVWKIKKDNEDIVYAVDFNHRKESHLNGTVLLSSEALARPSLLITDTFYSHRVGAALSRRTRDEKLFDILEKKLSMNGNILIPIETSTRILELAYTLEDFWKRRKLQQHLIFLSHQSQSTIVYAKSMLEWMGDSISQSFQTRDQPFDFRYLKCLQSLEELENLSGPKVVLASFPSLEFGFAQDLLIQWASNESNCIVFPERPPVDSIGWNLYNQWKTSENKDAPVSISLDIPLTIGKKVPLEGEELEAYLAEEQKQEDEKEIFLKELDLANLSDSDDEMEEVVGENGAPGIPVYDIYVKDHVNRKGFFKQSQAFRMYPVHEVRNRVDEYGELLDLAAFSKFEQKVPDDNFDLMDIEMPAPEEVVVKATPSKYISEDIMLSIRCQVFHIDFEGRSDFESMKNIIQQLAPRKVLFIHGSDQSIEDISDFCSQSDQITDEIFTPAVNERVSISVATNLFQVVLTDSLVSSLKLSTLNEYNLAYVSGIIKTQDTPNGPQLFLEPLPEMEKKQRKSVPVGDIKLSELKRHLIQQGFTAQFAAGGILVVNGAYVIQKNAQGGVTVDGRVHEDYYKLREVVYGFTALLN